MAVSVGEPSRLELPRLERCRILVVDPAAVAPSPDRRRWASRLHEERYRRWADDPFSSEVPRWTIPRPRAAEYMIGEACHRANEIRKQRLVLPRGKSPPLEPLAGGTHARCTLY